MQTENFTLGKKELLIVLGLTLVLPFPINWALIELNPLTLMAGADDVPTWIGFGGSYIGGIIGGIISIMILNKTLQQTGVLHHELNLKMKITLLKFILSNKIGLPVSNKNWQRISNLLICMC